MAMIRIFFAALIVTAAVSARANDGSSLGLTAADLDRLGIVLQAPRIISEIEIASGPAEVVIPPSQEAVVSSTVSGVLTRALVAEGDFVSAGQPLAEITSSDLLALQSEYVEAALAMDLARVQLQRDQGLHSDGIIAERRLRESSAAERTASTAQDQLRQQLMLAGMSQTELANLLATHALTPTLELKAPFAAFVIEQRSALGARVDTLDPVYRVADLSELWLELHVPQERSERIKPGMRVVTTTADRIIEGEVLNIGRVADSSSQTVLVRAAIANEDLALRVGQYLPARILDANDQRDAALAVPTAAIVRVDGNTYVFGRRNDEIAALPVQIIAEDGTNTYIHSEFDAETEIAIAGVAVLKSVWVSAGEEGE
jgi:cobalt-zinc-cadmium efflux system membrane fusion protein